MERSNLCMYVSSQNEITRSKDTMKKPARKIFLIRHSWRHEAHIRPQSARGDMGVEGNNLHIFV